MDHFLTVAEASVEQIAAILVRSSQLRAQPEPVLAGKSLCCLFEKASLRTRVSFEQAMRKLGGTAMSMSQQEVGVGARESPEDVARVLSQMVDCIMARVMSHRTLELMASVSAVPIVNGLSDQAHPAQAVADALTIMDEFSPGDTEGLRGRSVAFVGDGNNVARSLAVICGKLGMNFRICTPPHYELDPTWVADTRKSLAMNFDVCDDPREAVAGVDAIYCDTFVSMGQEHERTQRLAAFGKYQVNAELVGGAPSHAIVLHCLPASRGIEITDEVMDGPRSRVFRQAGNRMWGQMGLLATLLG